MNTFKISMGALVISVVELVLGLLGIGLVLQIQATRFNATTDYVSIYSYASALLLAAALAFLARSLLSSPSNRARRMVRANIYLAVAAFVMTTGIAILSDVRTWTTPLTCDGCTTITLQPSVNEVVASVVLRIGGGTLAALLPIIVLVLLRSRRDAAPSPPPAPPGPPEPPPLEAVHQR